MSLNVGDHLVIKRRGQILTSDAGEAYHEFEVLEPIESVGINTPPSEKPYAAGYKLLVKVIK